MKTRLTVALLFFLVVAQASQPSIWVDSVNGAPTPNASGSPEDMSPVSALATCHTNGSASTTIQWPSHGITLPSGNACDQGANNCGILFLGTGSGRKFTEIYSVPNGNTLLVEDSFNIAAGTPVDCAVGGRLLNLEPQLALDMKGNHLSNTHGNAAGGWEIFLVASGVNYTWSAGRQGSGAGAGFYGVKDAGVRPIVECNFDPGFCLQLSGPDLVGIEFRNTSGTKTGTVGIDLNSGAGGIVRDVILGGPAAASAFETAIDWDGGDYTIVGSLIRNSDVGIDAQGVADNSYSVLATVFQDNGIGITNLTGIGPAWRLIGNLFWGQTTGVEVAHTTAEAATYTALLFNTFHDNTTAFSITNQLPLMALVFAGNLLTNNSTGVDYSGPARNIERESALVDFNCYGQGAAANGQNIDGFVLGPNVINVDPQYANAATGDFTPTNPAAAFRTWPPGLNGLTPRFFPGTITEGQLRCGAIQAAGSGGSPNVGF